MNRNLEFVHTWEVEYRMTYTYRKSIVVQSYNKSTQKSKCSHFGYQYLRERKITILLQTKKGDHGDPVTITASTGS